MEASDIKIEQHFHCDPLIKSTLNSLSSADVKVTVVFLRPSSNVDLFMCQT